MSIDISGISNRQIQSGSDSRVSSNTGRATATPAAMPGDDRVSLTGSAGRLQQLASQVAQLPVVDAQQVSEVQQAVATGEFQFEPEEAAENLLTQEREFAALEEQ